MSQTPRYTTGNGAPVPHDDISQTAGPNGSLTFDNWRLFEKLAHFNRERIPERVVHARGVAAYGTFTLTRDLSDLTIARFLQGVGKQTSLLARFSTVAGGQDSGDNTRDVRGFSLKFYTEDGNWDMVGNNTPVFFIREPSKFPDFIHTQKKDPRTNMVDWQNRWEFWANHPQALHQVTILMSDRGIPKSLTTMNGYSSHTLSLWNDKGERVWVKWHFKTDQGHETLTDDQAAQVAPDFHQHDMFTRLERGERPSWTVNLQVMTEAQARDYHINPFDLTKVWPHGDFPLMEVGKMELNRNPENYFAEVEQSVFSPSNFVPGIGASPDRVLQARLWAYADAHRYRVGANAEQLPVNRPVCPVNHYQRDGVMAGMCPVTGHGGGPLGGQVGQGVPGETKEGGQYSRTNFYPNERADQGAPVPDATVAEPAMPLEQNAWMGYHDNSDEDNYSQAGNLYRLFDEGQKTRITDVIAGTMVGVSHVVQDKMIAHFRQADADYGDRIATKLAKLDPR